MIVPVGERLLVKPEKVEEMSAGGIVIPRGSQERMESESIRGVVIAIGEFAWVEHGSRIVEVGDNVIFAKWGGLLVEEDGETYRLLNDVDIIAVVKSDVGE